MAAKFFVGLDLSDPDPECVKGNADGLVAAAAGTVVPLPSPDHSRPGASSPIGSGAVPITLGRTRR
jgi:hypothetical protein